MDKVQHMVVLNPAGEIIPPPRTICTSLAQLVRASSAQGALLTQTFVFDYIGRHHWGQRKICIHNTQAEVPRLNLTGVNSRTGGDDIKLTPKYCFSPRDGLRMLKNETRGPIMIIGDQHLYEHTLDMINSVVAVVCTSIGARECAPMGRHPLANYLFDHPADNNPYVVWRGAHACWYEMPVHADAVQYKKNPLWQGGQHAS